MCLGEACDLCGAGCWNNSVAVRCEHDVLERHRITARRQVIEVKAGFEITGYGPGWALYCGIPFWRMYANGVRIQHRMTSAIMGIPLPW